MSAEPTDSVRCPDCGYDLRGQEQPRCPECGFRYDRAGIVALNLEWWCRRLQDLHLAAAMLIGVVAVAGVRLLWSYDLLLLVLASIVGYAIAGSILAWGVDRFAAIVCNNSDWRPGGEPSISAYVVAAILIFACAFLALIQPVATVLLLTAAGLLIAMGSWRKYRAGRDGKAAGVHAEVRGRVSMWLRIDAALSLAAAAIAVGAVTAW